MKLVFTVLLLVVGTGCGIGPQESPQTLRAPADTPSAALEPSDPITPAEQTELRATVYLVTDTDDLVAVVRPVAVDGGADEQLAAVLGSLIEGPSDADADTAAAATERLRARIEELRVGPVEHTFTASFGVAQWRPGETPGSLLQRADKLLYRAKAEGRNRVVSDS